MMTWTSGSPTCSLIGAACSWSGALLFLHWASSHTPLKGAISRGKKEPNWGDSFLRHLCSIDLNHQAQPVCFPSRRNIPIRSQCRGIAWTRLWPRLLFYIHHCYHVKMVLRRRSHCSGGRTLYNQVRFLCSVSWCNGSNFDYLQLLFNRYA